MLRAIIDGFADELAKHATALPPRGIRRDEALALDLMRELHPQVGGDDPLLAMQLGRMEAIERQLRRHPVLEWLSRALQTGELSRAPVGPEIAPGRSAMERVLSVAEPLTKEQVAIARAWPNPSLLEQLKGIVGEHRPVTTALNAMMRR